MGYDAHPDEEGAAASGGGITSDPTDGPPFWDDFDDVTIQLRWGQGGSGALGQSPSQHNHGVATLTPTAGGTDHKELFGNNAYRPDGFASGSQIVVVAKMDAEWDASDNGLAFFGLAQSLGATKPNDGIYFTQDDSLGANYFAVTASGGTRSEEDTGVAVSNAFKKFTINLEASSIEFLIDDSVVATIATNITSNAIGRILLNGRTGGAGGGTKVLSVDSYWIKPVITRGL